MVGRGGGGKTFDEKGSGTNSHSSALFLLSPTEADSFPFSGLGDKSSENGIIFNVPVLHDVLKAFCLGEENKGICPDKKSLLERDTSKPLSPSFGL